HRDNGVDVVIAGLGGVIGPLEGLEGLLEAAVIVEGRPLAHAREGLVATQPDGLALGLVLAADGKAHEPGSLALVHVEPKKHDMGASDRIDGDIAQDTAAHGTSPPARTGLRRRLTNI